MPFRKVRFRSGEVPSTAPMCSNLVRATPTLGCGSGHRVHWLRERWGEGRTVPMPPFGADAWPWVPTKKGRKGGIRRIINLRKLSILHRDLETRDLDGTATRTDRWGRVPRRTTKPCLHRKDVLHVGAWSVEIGTHSPRCPRRRAFAHYSNEEATMEGVCGSSLLCGPEKNPHWRSLEVSWWCTACPVDLGMYRLE